MKKTRSNKSVAVVKNKDGKIIGYLTAKDEEKGKDIKLDMQGYTIEALDEVKKWLYLKIPKVKP